MARRLFAVFFAASACATSSPPVAEDFADGSVADGAVASPDASDTDADDGATLPNEDAAMATDAGPPWPLGMNDVTILTPLPANMTTPVLLLGAELGLDGAPLIARDLYDRLVAPACFGPHGDDPCSLGFDVLAPHDYERLHLVAVRFDLCDRNLPGTCADGEDGRLRLVWQSMLSDTEFADVGFHAFFSIPSAQLASAVAELRELARMQAEPLMSALTVSPALSDPGKAEYRERLRAFVRAHAQRARLVRLTLNAQPATLSQVRWLLRGLERHEDGQFREIEIPGSTAVRQDVILSGAPGYEAFPAVDLPSGLAGVLSQPTFEAASADARASMLEALLDADHPTRVAPGTAPCVACHASSVLFEARRAAAAIDVESLDGAYVTPHDVSIDAGKAQSSRTLRALGYFLRAPVISRRVAHETAQVLSEIAQRFR